MPTRYLSLAICSLALLLPSISAQAQQPAAPLAPAPSHPTAPPPAPEPTPAPAPASTPAAAKTPDVPVDAASKAIAEAMLKMDQNDLDGAAAKLTDAIKANPKLAGPYVFRASVYIQKKQWPQAEADFKTASQLDPTNVVIKLNLAEIKFMQKQYDQARVGYAALTKDPQMGDLAAYKVFLCDLMAGNDAQAIKERDAFDVLDVKPSYYLSKAAYDLYHKHIDSARGWLISATNIYPSAKITYYIMPLKDLGYLPLPPPAGDIGNQ
jgi:Tfp pilus assembly protein PilF